MDILNSYTIFANSFEDFVMAPIKCAPPKIVAVKRSLKKNLKNNIMDDDEILAKESESIFELVGDEDSLHHSKNLIEFEEDEPLIDLSDTLSNEQQNRNQDTFTHVNSKNSNTLLDLLETSRIMCRTETALGSCAEDSSSDTFPRMQKNSLPSSSLQNIPVECPGACAGTGKTDSYLSVQQPLSIQIENPSIVKKYSPQTCKSSYITAEISNKPSYRKDYVSALAETEGIPNENIDSTLQNFHQCQSEKLIEEKLISTSFHDYRDGTKHLVNNYLCSSKKHKNNEKKNLENILCKGNENFYNCNKQQNEIDPLANRIERKNSNTDKLSDSNNNFELVYGQNLKKDANNQNLVSENNSVEDNFNFLSSHTSQRKLPPRFFSSTNSLNRDCFEASLRLKRLEERFKGFSYTKKLLRNSKVFSKSEEILSSYGKAKELTLGESLNLPVQFPLTLATLSECSLGQLVEEDDNNNCKQEIGTKLRESSSINDISEIPIAELRSSLSEGSQVLLSPLQRLHSPDSTEASEEICKIFGDKHHNNNGLQSDENCSFVYYEENPSDHSGEVTFRELEDKPNLFDDIIFSNCEFDVETFQQYLNERSDESEENRKHCQEHNCNSDDEISDESDFFCDCLVEAVPLYHPSIMRETGGKLRGLLKQPNRPPPVRKNRVVFDETRNEFFEADYIILIREDCPYDEEDEEPCTCGDHELVRICCDEGCNCGYTDDGRTPPSPKFAPPIEFVDQATLSPPEGYKDGGLLDSALSGALSNHVFGAQHIQQLQVIQRLQQQRAAMLAARAAAANTSNQQTIPVIEPQQQQAVCTECAECAECAAAKLAELEGECDSQCSEEASPMEAAPPHVLAIGSLVPVQKSSPERRNQKEIVAGEERPKFMTVKQTEDAQAEEPNVDVPPPKPPKALTLQPPAIPEGRSVYATSQLVENMKNDLNATVIPKFNVNGTAQAITGILKGGKLRKTEPLQLTEETNNTTSDEETSSKRSVRFNEEPNGDSGYSENQNESTTTDDEGKPKSENQLTDYVTHMSLKRHSSLFHNALRPNSAVRQLFPSTSPPSTLTHEALKAFDESKRGNLLVSPQTMTSAGSVSSNSTSPTPLAHSASDTDTIKRTIERNALRRSLIKYEPKKKITTKDSTSLEERIRQLTCDIDEPGPADSDGNNSTNVNEMERRDSPAGEETPQSQTKFEKSFSPSSSASSSSSCSTGSTYKKITDLFNKDKRQEKILETDENPIVIIPQDCRCPAGPDIGMGVQIQAHTQIHQPPPPPRHPETKRQFLSTTLAPLTACVAGQRDDFSYYMLAKPGERTSTASSQTTDQYSIGDIDAALQDTEVKKVAPDVIAGTPGQESDELASFAQQEANRLDRIKKRYSSDSAPASGVNSDDDEQNDYGFNKRPSVRGIKPRFGSTNEILQQMQDQLSQPSQAPSSSITAPAANSGSQMQSNTLPRTNPSGGLQIATAKQQTHQHTPSGSWSYYPDQQQQPQVKKVVDNYANYYHLPAHSRHSYHGHEAIYQNCHTMTVQQTQQAVIPGHVHQKLQAQTSQPQIQAIQQAQQANRFSQYARSPTRRPESPPPLRNYHQTMVLIPYKPESGGYPAYGISGETNENIYQRQQNIVEYHQQVTQQTIRVPIGYPLPGMQLHVVSGRATTPHFATLPRQGGHKFSYPDKPSMERGVPEGEAASVQQSDSANNIIPSATCQEVETNNNNNNSTVYYAMNV